MRRVILGVATAIVGMSMLLKLLFGVALHLFTVWMAFEISGLFAAGLTLILPVMAQMYWIVAVWAHVGVLFNFYTLACLAYIGLWILAIFAASIASAAEN